MELESKTLLPIELTRFDGDHWKWPDFIQNFENRVHEKQSFTDDIRMERLISVLDGDAKRAVAAEGHNELFYASALKLLKQDSGNPLVVSYKKVKRVPDQPQIQPNDKTSLQRYHQSLRSTVIRLKSMGYHSAIQSVENLTKAVMRLPRFMRSEFYLDFKDSTYDSNDLNLEYFEKWLANRLTEMFNPIAAIIETRENTKQNHSDKNKDNKHNRQQHSIFQMSGNNSNIDKQTIQLKVLVLQQQRS